MINIYLWSHDQWTKRLICVKTENKQKMPDTTSRALCLNQGHVVNGGQITKGTTRKGTNDIFAQRSTPLRQNLKVTPQKLALTLKKKGPVYMEKSCPGDSAHVFSM